MTSTGRRGFVGIDRRWLADENLSDSALRLMLWLDSHTHEYLRALNYTRTAEEIGWSRNRVKRTLDDLVELGLASVSQEQRKHGGTVARITLHHDVWTDGSLWTTDTESDGPPWTSAMVHGEASAMVHGEARTTSNSNGRKAEENVGLFEPDTPPEERLCNLMAELIEQMGTKRPNVTKTWIEDMERMIRLDDRDPEHVERVIRWLYTSSADPAPFWAANILSPAKLRSKWDQMALQVRRRQQRNRGGAISVVDGYLQGEAT